MYVAVKGGEAAIANAHKLLDERRRGDRSLPALTLAQIVEQLGLAVDRVMAEGSLYDRELAALSIKQARGDIIEAIFLLRAYRTTLPRFGYSEPVDTGAMRVDRRISATYKDLPGGSFSARPSTIRTGFSTLRWPAGTSTPSQRPGVRPGTARCRGSRTCSPERG